MTSRNRFQIDHGILQDLLYFVSQCDTGSNMSTGGIFLDPHTIFVLLSRYVVFHCRDYLKLLSQFISAGYSCLGLPYTNRAISARCSHAIQKITTATVTGAEMTQKMRNWGAMISRFSSASRFMNGLITV
jgi:hypothetical protein